MAGPIDLPPRVKEQIAKENKPKQPKFVHEHRPGDNAEIVSCTIQMSDGVAILSRGGFLKRERMAMEILKAYVSLKMNDDEHADAPLIAVEMADRLLAELAATEPAIAPPAG